MKSIKTCLNIATLTSGLIILPSLGIAANWPQWRGSDHSDICKETGLLKKWPSGGPPLAWISRDAGIGYAGTAVVDGKLYTMGSDDNQEFLISVDTRKGHLLWKSRMGPVLANNWGDGPRGTPTVNDGRVYAINGTGVLICADAGSGKIIWKKNLKSFGSKVPSWGYTESVLVDGDKVICTPGSKQALLLALNKKTGNVIWKTAGVKAVLQYSSIVPAKINGTHQYIQLFKDKLVGIAADSGKLIWESPWPGKTAVIPTPIVKGNEIYIACGYNIGCKKVRIDKNNKPSDVYKNNVMENHHGGVILLDDHLYGHHNRKGLTCQSFETGELLWANQLKAIILEELKI